MKPKPSSKNLPAKALLSGWRPQNQSATASVVNDVKSNSDIYDIVALDATNAVVGTLSGNGLVSYGDLHIDGGIRWESDDATAIDGNTAKVNQPVQPGVVGLVRTVGSTFDGTYTTTKRNHAKAAYTVGANYLITPAFSVYARYAEGFQTNNIDPITTIELIEAGVRYQYGRLFNGSATVFRTNFKNQSYNFADPVNRRFRATSTPTCAPTAWRSTPTSTR